MGRGDRRSLLCTLAVTIGAGPAKAKLDWEAGYSAGRARRIFGRAERRALADQSWLPVGAQRAAPLPRPVACSVCSGGCGESQLRNGAGANRLCNG